MIWLVLVLVLAAIVGTFLVVRNNKKSIDKAEATVQTAKEKAIRLVDDVKKDVS